MFLLTYHYDVPIPSAGGTALAFQCVWPKRFGPNALLACKVLKDGYEVDVRMLQTFMYDAQVLATVR